MEFSGRFKWQLIGFAPHIDMTCFNV